MKSVTTIKLPIDQQTEIFMIKPDGFKRNLESPIIEMLRRFGFSVLCRKEKILSKDEIKRIYQTTFERDYPEGVNDPRANKHINSLQSAPCIGFLVRHKTLTRPNLYEYSKKIRGESWLPIKCSIDSIRYQLRNFDFDNYQPIYSEDRFLLNQVPENVIHASLTDEELENIYHVFFKDFFPETDFLPHQYVLPEKKIAHLVLVVTFSMSSSDKMNVKMHCGVSHLQAYLSSQGFNVTIKAFGKETPDEVVEELLALSPDIIGFSTVASELPYISTISRILKIKAPGILQVGGGAHFSIFPQDILATNIDAVCVGEGEYPLRELLSGKTFKASKNWVYRDGSTLVMNETTPFISDISSLPIPNHTLWNEHDEQRQYPHRRILISRGCPYACTYCSNRPLSQVAKGIYTRFRTPESIESEIVHVLENFQNTEVIFLESEILHPKFSDVDGILKVTSKYKNRLRFGTNLRIEVVNKDFLYSLQTNGFDFAYIGLESGSEHIRKNILNRNYSNQDVIDVFTAAKQTNFKLSTYNLVGLPDETRSEFLQTVTLNKICQPYEAQIAIFFPYPGTELYYMSLDKGYIKNPFFHHYFNGKERRSPILEMPDFPVEEITNSYCEFRSTFG